MPVDLVARIARRRFLGLGAVGLLAVPVAVGVIARPKKVNACAGPIGGGEEGNGPAPRPRKPHSSASWRFLRGDDHDLGRPG
jgi:hypothetical protein